MILVSVIMFLLLFLQRKFFENSSIPRWNFKRANWGKFSEKANFDVPMNTFDNIDSLCDYITDTIVTAASQSIPVSKPINGKISVPWWSEKLDHTTAIRSQF